MEQLAALVLLVIILSYATTEWLIVRARRRSFERHWRDALHIIDTPAEDRDDWGRR